MMRRALFVLLPVLLAGCGDSQQAAYVMGDRRISLSIVRQQTYYGGEWSNELITSRFPECQRRHLLKPTNNDGFKLDVFRPEQGVYILNQGKRWYVTTLAGCQFQQYKDAPPEPGVLIGTFQVKDGEFKYLDKEAKDKPAEAGAPPAPSAPAAQPAPR